MQIRSQDEIGRLPNNVQDAYTACCLFCPYGTELQVGERVYAFDEQTVLGGRQREVLVEVTAVKLFRSNGRVVTLDLRIASAEELQRIAVDSEVSVTALINHRMGAETYDSAQPPVVIYFKPAEEDSYLAQSITLPPGRRQSV